MKATARWLFIEDRMMSDEKIVSLEEKIIFLQKMIDDLNMVVFRQGEKIDQINSKLKETNEQIISQSESNNSKIQDTPPHY